MSSSHLVAAAELSMSSDNLTSLQKCKHILGGTGGRYATLSSCFAPFHIVFLEEFLIRQSSDTYLVNGQILTAHKVHASKRAHLVIWATAPDSCVTWACHRHCQAALQSQSRFLHLRLCSADLQSTCIEMHFCRGLTKGTA